MKTMNDERLQTIIQELTILIKEIETKPEITPWTIRMTLKRIVDKAERMTDNR